MQSKWTRDLKREAAVALQAMTAALAIRLRSNASFRQKLRQLIVKMRKEKAPADGRFPGRNRLRSQQF
jgi:hypothetical protein